MLNANQYAKKATRNYTAAAYMIPTAAIGLTFSGISTLGSVIPIEHQVHLITDGPFAVSLGAATTFGILGTAGYQAAKKSVAGLTKIFETNAKNLHMFGRDNESESKLLQALMRKLPKTVASAAALTIGGLLGSSIVGGIIEPQSYGLPQWLEMVPLYAGTAIATLQLLNLTDKFKDAVTMPTNAWGALRSLEFFFRREEAEYAAKNPAPQPAGPSLT